MDRLELERVLELHRKAYNLLLWIGQQANSQADTCAAEAVEHLQHADDCESWVRRNQHNLPVESQPSQADVRPFALLLTSFFRTSFHVEQIGAGEQTRPMLKRGARSSPRRGSAKRRDRKVMKDLEIIALRALAGDAGIEPSGEQLASLVEDNAVANDLCLWSYACELHRRSQFASQGPAVHRMWLEIDPAERKQLTVNAIWQARERLLGALKGLAAQHSRSRAYVSKL